MMKVKYIGETDECCLIQNKVYDCLGEEKGLLRVIDEEGIDEDEDVQGYLYSPELFEILK